MAAKLIYTTTGKHDGLTNKKNRKLWNLEFAHLC